MTVTKSSIYAGYAVPQVKTTARTSPDPQQQKRQQPKPTPEKEHRLDLYA